MLRSEDNVSPTFRFKDLISACVSLVFMDDDAATRIPMRRSIATVAGSRRTHGVAMRRSRSPRLKIVSTNHGSVSGGHSQNST